MRALAADPDFARVRYYSTEDAADLGSVPVLRHMGLDAAAQSEYLKRNVLRPEDETRCRQILAAGQVPPYGNLSDNHHGTCWRAWHIRAYAAATASQ